MISLEKACISLISEEFERFHFAFATTNDEILKRNFEVLQRAYTFELGSELSEKGNLEDEYLEFLLNEHLDILDENWLKKSCYENWINDIICRLPNIKKISLAWTCNDEILKNIAKFCPQIVEIDASCSSVTDMGIKYLCKNENGNVPCPALKKLSVGLCSITDEGLIYLLQSLPSLEKIDHRKVPEILYYLHKEDLHNLGRLPTFSLVHLDLLQKSKLPYYTDLLKICLKACPKLKSVSCEISLKKQLVLFKNTSLEELELKVLKSKKRIDINNFLKHIGYNLVSLKIFNCIMSVNVLALSCPKLKSLDMDKCIISDDHMDPSSIFKCLIKCTFRGVFVDSTINKAINSLLTISPNLEYLTFDSSNVEPYINTFTTFNFSENNFLKNITFSKSSVDMRMVKDILINCPTLKTLELDWDDYWHSDRREILCEFVKALPNKPDISLEGYCFTEYNHDF